MIPEFADGKISIFYADEGNINQLPPRLDASYGPTLTSRARTRILGLSMYAGQVLDPILDLARSEEYC